MRQLARGWQGAGGVVRVVAKSGPDGTAAVRKGLGAPGKVMPLRLAHAVPASGAARFGASGPQWRPGRWSAALSASTGNDLPWL